MEERVTLIKPYRKKEALRLATLKELADIIGSERYAEEVAMVRYLTPLVNIRLQRDGQAKGVGNVQDKLPRICFALQKENRKGQSVTLSYTRLVLIEVDHLTGIEEAEAVRQGAAEIPHTLMAFVGADGRSVKIVCRGASFDADGQTADEQLFHENLYERARLIYNGQLGVTVDKLEPLPERICYMSHDQGVYLNSDATPVYAKSEKPTALSLGRAQQRSAGDDYDQYLSLHNAYEFCLTRAYDECEHIGDDGLRKHSVLTLLAKYAMQSGIPLGMAQHLTLLRSGIGSDELLVRKVFENAYREDQVEKFMKRKGLERTRALSPEALLTMKINLFLTQNYDLRKNVMRGVAEYRPKTGIGFSFEDLTEEARNSITMRALELGIRCWDKDIRRFVNSEDIIPYDPLNDYLERLPKWDGQDRVTALARRIPTDYTAWEGMFRLWMRSMVAMWLGKGLLTGNALVPLLIGRQGCGKSSFCRILLPRELQDYYNDRINFKNESDLNLGLTSFGLINLDEFDKITQRQQVVLKYLLSTADLKYRPPYGKAYSQHRRYASFIGTTNELHPLTDPTGSRRFICTLITGDIDFHTPVDHAQLLAQLKTEIARGERYWLTKDEEQALMQHNLDFQRLNGLGEMLLSLIQKPHSDDDKAVWMSLKELSAMVKKQFGSYKEDANALQKIGYFLSRPEYKFDSRRTNAGMQYRVKLKV